MGVIVELEKDRYDNNWTFASDLLMEKEWGAWTGFAKLWVIYDWGDTVKSALVLQTRDDYSRYFEPALEFYNSQNIRGNGLRS